MSRSLPTFWALHPDTLKARADVAPPPAVGGIASMAINGPVYKDKHPTAPSWAAVREFIAAAKADPSITGVAFYADSGGGAVAGMQSAAHALRAMGKPSLMIVADGAACGSAVFYFGSACSLGIWAAPLAMVGGIGVYIPIDSDPVDPAIVSSLTPAKHLPDTDPRAQASIQRAAEGIAAVMLADMAAWKGLSGPEEAARFYGEGEMFVAADAPAGMIAGLAMDPPLHLFNPAGALPAIPGGDPMAGLDPRAEAEGMPPDVAEPMAEVEAEPEVDYSALTPEERAALVEEMKVKIAEIEAIDAPAEPAAPAPNASARRAAGEAFASSLVATGKVLPAQRSAWVAKYTASPDAAVVEAQALKPALHTRPNGDARREPAAPRIKTGHDAVQHAKAFAKVQGIPFAAAVARLCEADPHFNELITGGAR